VAYAGRWQFPGYPALAATGTLVEGHLEMSATLVTPSCPQGFPRTFSGDFVPEP
jgi:hypothetical protein